MTTIAWDGKMLAADRQITQGESFLSEATKIACRTDGALIGCAGDTCTAAAFLRWFIAGESDPAPSLQAKNSEQRNAAALIVRADGAMEYHDKAGWHAIESAPFAFGSGDVAAMTAMLMGADARKAIEMAAKLDIYTGGGIDVLWLREPARELQAELSKRMGAG